MNTYIRVPKDGANKDDPHGIPNSIIEAGRDGVEKRRPGDPKSRSTYLGAMMPVALNSHIDVTAAMQIAIWDILGPMIMYRNNLEKIVSGSVESSSFRFDRIVFDMPEAGENVQPLPVAVIIPQGKAVYANPDFETSLLEDSIDCYGENTVLRRYSNCEQEIAIHVLSAHKEERRATKAAFEREFLAEPNDDQTGRRVNVKQYYDRTVRLNLRDIDSPENAPRTIANEYELVAVLDVKCDVVQLVSRPSLVKRPRFDVALDSES